MPYKVRPLDWRLMLDPTMAGIQSEVAAGARLGGLIAGGGADIGAGITRGRQERESRRRFSAEQSQQQQRMDRSHGLDLRRQALDEREFMERQRERQSNETAMLDGVTHAVSQVEQEMASRGQVKPETGQALTQFTDALGGPEAVQERLAKRAIPEAQPIDWSAPEYAGMVPNPTTLGQRQKQYQAAGGQVAAPAAQAAPQMAPSAPVVGEGGVPERPSEELATEADSAARVRELAKAAMDEARRALHSNSLKGPVAREAARLAYHRALSMWTKAGERESSLSRRAASVAKVEAARRQAAEEQAKAGGRVDELRHRIGGLQPHDQEMFKDPAAVAEMEAAAFAGAPAGDLVTDRLRRSDEQKGAGRAATAQAERETLVSRGQPLPPRLMSQEEKNASMMERLRARVGLYEANRMPREQAAAEAKRDNDVERELDRALYRYDPQSGQVAVQEVDWGRFSEEDIARLYRLRERGEMDAEAERQFPIAARQSEAVAAREETFGPQGSAPPASEPQATGGVKAQVDAIMADGSLSVEEKRRRLKALRAGS
jgi:hypothetical protein